MPSSHGRVPISRRIEGLTPSGRDRVPFVPVRGVWARSCTPLCPLDQ
jgi:hypothetical protein